MKTILIIAIALIFLSGAANGLHETLVWHYPAFKAKLPSANDQYWNPQISWKNKYANYPENVKPRFFGSTTFLVFITDAKHLFSELHRWFLFFGSSILATVFFIKGGKWWFVKLTILWYVVQSIGFHLVYTLFF